MRITGISAQTKNPDRVNVAVDGKYRLSLNIHQVVELGLKVGNVYTEDTLKELELESQFGKLYARTLEYCLMRPHSAREVRDYLWRKTRPGRVQKRDGSGFIDKPGVDPTLTERVFTRLESKGYINDEKFTRFWVENRHLRKGISTRKLTQELRSKGVDQTVITDVLQESKRSDNDELTKMIEKKASRYTDRQKLTQYLLRQGFSYDDVRTALDSYFQE